MGRVGTVARGAVDGHEGDAMSNPKLTGYGPQDRELASWVRGVEAFAKAIVDITRVACEWNSDNAPLSVRTSLSVMPSSVLLLSATTGTGTLISGAPVTWSWNNGSIVISAIGTLTASTDYDLVLGVVA
jgi:hypothetical protein